jgi:pimeloyl-ACP methyl ester carboxylesterase
MLSAVTADGVTLALTRVPARGSRRAVLLCTHAMMANGRYFGAGDGAARGGGFADTLAAAGVDVFVLDWRGHGRSRPPVPGKDDWCFDDYVERDLPAALAAVSAAARVATYDVAVLGHSLGGSVALAAVGAGLRVRRLVLAATSLWLPGPRGPWRRRAVMGVYAGAARVLGRAPIRALRLGSDDEPRGYVTQLAGWARTGQWTSRRGVDHMAALAGIDVPVWAFSGAGDRLCAPADAHVMLARLRGAPALRVVGVAGGDAIDADHFTLFTEPRLAPVWRELAAAIAT